MNLGMFGYVVRDNAPSQPTDTILVSMSELRLMIREELTKAMGTHTTEEKLITAKEAAALMSVSPDWLYRNASKLPFARKIGPRALRFSKIGLEKWMNSRRTVQ